MTRKIVVTGGHHTPALAVIKSLQRQAGASALSFFWVGHRFSMWGDRNVSVEYRQVTDLGIPFFDLRAGKFHNTLHPLKLIRIPFGFLQAFIFLLMIRPHLVVSFGGYLAVPVVFAAWLLRIPVVTHEQTTVAGSASRFIAIFARKVFISFESSARFFPKKKTYLIGNPLREEIFIDQSHLDFGNGRRTIYFTGGKQGSHVINKFVESNLVKILPLYNVIHQCGSSSVNNDFFSLTSLFNRLDPKLKKGYLVKDFFGSDEIGSVFAAASVVVSRSGANAVYEIGALGKPAILIPISWSSHQEQRFNAQFLAGGGGAVILEEVDLNETSFLAVINQIFSTYTHYKRQAELFSQSFPRDAGDVMAREILSAALSVSAK